ncbi:hypothetical protein DSCO28_18180 [Desulfosarcina ovata subsp. sediminis]|uniref:DUF2442 domain-containing protein n=1 Tax=Desulfosarcina ovata subsp. sediminis TaxID=885957 RepID=A0A5K7ZGN2_9BACT|nr:DUF2442 domain-containing protein [Desulfosarcina ovata]BBO81252.1 hypothetical protein DSCO28_18180 [Desulfosarcina ovata subsp. sediminis]
MDIPHAVSIFIDEDMLTVELDDGRTVSVPIAWYPRLLHASKEEQANWRLIGKGHGIHWENVDEDISVESILTGRQSGESQASLKNGLKIEKNEKQKII